jgi:hypothetical protein
LSIAISPPVAQQHQAALVVRVVARLVRIDEGEVVAARLARGDARVERRERGPELQVDLAGDARGVPERPADAGVVVADVAGEEPAVLGQREGDRERAVAGEDADLDRPPRADDLDEQGEELRLLGADLHARRGMRAGRLADADLRPRLARRVGDEVGAKLVVEGGVAIRHAGVFRRCVADVPSAIHRGYRSRCIRACCTIGQGVARASLDKPGPTPR